MERLGYVFEWSEKQKKTLDSPLSGDKWGVICKGFGPVKKIRKNSSKTFFIMWVFISFLFPPQQLKSITKYWEKTYNMGHNWEKVCYIAYFYNIISHLRVIFST